MSHQDRREPLPKGYQYGDAGYPRAYRLGDRLHKGEILTTIDEGGTRTRTVTKGELFRLTVQEDEQAREVLEYRGVIREGQN